MADTLTDIAPARPGIYARGTETVDAILKAALSVLIDEGATAFTIRRIAAACDMKVGNVSYHFPRKEMLVHVMLDDIVETYDAKLELSVRQPNLSAEERLRIVIIICLDDISSKRTTHLFTELWALANQNDFIADKVRAFYQKVHGVIGEYVRELNPALNDEEVHTLALFISASMEGTTPFLGHKKPWAVKMPEITALSAKWFVHLAKTIKPGEIAELTKAIA
jgi:AcrR family transcriptional regulator